MLVISRKINEGLIINDDIEIVILEASKDKVKIGIKAPKNVNVSRKEIYSTKQENITASVCPRKEVLEELIKSGKEK